MATLNFNANDVEPTTAFEPLPAGKYLAEITASETKPVKSGNGTYLQLEFTVLDGPCKGRKAWDRLCINHPNDLTQKIARGNLSAICRAVGIMQPGDSVELHGIPLLVTIACKNGGTRARSPTNSRATPSARRSSHCWKMRNGPGGRTEKLPSNAALTTRP